MLTLKFQMQFPCWRKSGSRPGGWMQLGVIVAVKLKAEFPKKYCQEVDGK